MSVIKVLPTLVANQIAAGEVVERPASVLKELLENCIDAGATRIDIKIEGGGIGRMQVTDDGCGMDKEDLPLAFMQHATSKISTLEDIEKIQSMGFRGEALASIASVAKVEIISKHQEASQAWSLSNQHHRTTQPAAHNVGTSVIVEDLFYNTPARRKFLRRPSTEFHAIEEVFRRIALTQFDIAFSLTHDGRLVRRLASCGDQASQQMRLEQLIGRQAIEDSMVIDIEQNGMRLWGWFGLPESSRAQADQQYFFINKRVVKDRLVNHAVREAYQQFVEAGRYPVFCLYFELPPEEVDVNVHPTKHEVRFRHARVVHCFLEDAIAQALQTKVMPQTQESLPAAQKTSFAQQQYHTPKNTTLSPQSSRAMEAYQRLIADDTSPVQVEMNSRLLTVLQGRYAFVLYAHRIFVLDIQYYRFQKLSDELKASWQAGYLESAPLLMAHSVAIPEETSGEAIEKLRDFGFECSEIGPGSLMVRTVPKPLLGQDVHYQACIEKCLEWLKQGADFETPEFIAEVNDWLAKDNADAPYHQAELMQWLRGMDKDGWPEKKLKLFRIKEITASDCEKMVKGEK